MKHFIEVSDILLYAYHGCMPEERKIGSEYLVNLKVETNFSTAAHSDNLGDAVDYVQLYQIVKKEMETPSNLLEHVGQRIVTEIAQKFDEVDKVWLRISKINPPINGEARAVSILIES